MSDETIFQTLKLFPTQNLTETPPILKKDEIYRNKPKKKAIKTSTRKKPSAKNPKNNKGFRAKRK